MCEQCWGEAGSPKIDNDKVHKAVNAIKLVYEDNPTGGYLHIVVDDWNLDDSSLDFCKTLSGDMDKPQLDCLKILYELTEDERYSALAMIDGLFGDGK